MHDDHALDNGEVHAGPIACPDRSIKGFGKERGTGAVLPNSRLSTGEDVELCHSRILRTRRLAALAQLLDPSRNVLVVVALQRGAQDGVEAPSLLHVTRAVGLTQNSPVALDEAC